MLTHEQKAAWLKRLRDPSSVQLRNGYTQYYSSPSDPMCCLAHGQYAITGDVHTYYGRDGFDIMTEMERSGHKNVLVDMNDNAMKSLLQIADYIEANVPSTDAP